MDYVASKSNHPFILLVEDNERNARLFGEILRANGYRLEIVGDGFLALHFVEIQHPDLILMDVHLPGMDGLTVTRKLKANPETAHIPIVALTAHAMPEHRTQMLEAGCCSYISKPISYRSFLDEIDRVLTMSAASVPAMRTFGGPNLQGVTDAVA